MIAFYCEVCGGWTPAAIRQGSVVCQDCGDPFACGECGAPIDAEGNCLRDGCTESKSR